MSKHNRYPRISEPRYSVQQCCYDGCRESVLTKYFKRDADFGLFAGWLCQEHCDSAEFCRACLRNAIDDYNMTSGGLCGECWRKMVSCQVGEVLDLMRKNWGADRPELALDSEGSRQSACLYPSYRMRFSAGGER